MLYKVIQMIGKSGDEVLDKVTSSKLGKSDSDFPVYVSDLFTSPITVGSSTDSLIESGKTVVIHNGAKGKTAKVFRSIEVPELTDSSKALFSTVYGKDPESDSDKIVAYILSSIAEDWAVDPVKAAYMDFSDFYKSRVNPDISESVNKAVEKYHINDKNWKSLYAKAFVKARHDMAVSSGDKPEGKELIAGDDDLFEEVYDKAYQDWETYYGKRGSYIVDDSEEDWKKVAEEAFGKTQFPKTSLSDYIRAFIDTGSIAKREEIMNSKKNKAICSEEEVKDEEVVEEEETIGVEDEDAEKSDTPSEEFFETKEVSAELEDPQEAFEEIKDKAEEALEEIKETAEEAIAAQDPTSDLENEEVNEKIEEREEEEVEEEEESDDESEDEEEDESDDEEVESSKKPRAMKRRLKSSDAEDDGWSDEVRNILDVDLKSALRLDYEIKNGRRGALTMCTDQDMLAEHVYSLGQAFIEDAKLLGLDDIDSGKAPNLRDSMQDVIGKICSYKHDDVGDPAFMEAVDDFLDNVKHYLTLEQFLNEVMAYFPTATWAEFFRSIDSDYELDSAIGHMQGVESEEEEDYEDTEVEEISSEDEEDDFDVTVEDIDSADEPVDLGMSSRTPSSLRPNR